jgi:diadenosine tetraphosphate (Ap4A) HIT family hydrolase
MPHWIVQSLPSLVFRVSASFHHPFPFPLRRSYKTLIPRDTSMSVAPNDSRKVKVLFLGCLHSKESVTQCIIKIQQLHASPKTGPFDLLLGSCIDNTALQYLQSLYQQTHEQRQKATSTTLSMPIHLPPLYLQDTTVTAKAAAGLQLPPAETSSAPPSCLELVPNLFILRDATLPKSTFDLKDDPVAGIWNVPIAERPNTYLVVASLPPLFRTYRKGSSSPSNIHTVLQHASYIGCDILLSTEWPQGIENVYQQQQLASTPSMSVLPLHLSYDVADIALKSRPRYHMAFQQPSQGDSLQYYQSPPFSHMLSTISTRSITHTGRFIALCPVPNDTSPPAQSQKFLHAIGIIPLNSMSTMSDTIEKCSGAILSNPYSDVSYPIDDVPLKDSAHEPRQHPAVGGLSEAAARRIMAETSSNDNPQFRWSTSAAPANKRPRTEPEVDPSNCTLFVHGLQQDTTGQLIHAARSANENNLLYQALKSFGIEKVRVPPRKTSNYAFLDFPTHDQAADCLRITGGFLEVLGLPLTLKWASRPQAPNPGPKRLTEPEARDSSTLYFKYTASRLVAPSEPTNRSIEDVGETLRHWMERTLEVALMGDDGKEEDMVHAADEPALQVKLHLPKSVVDESDSKGSAFGFLNFASHAAASMALAILTGSTDGGRIVDDQQSAQFSKLQTNASPQSSILTPEMGIYLHWANDYVQPDIASQEKNVVQSEDGFQFERKHFPPDSRKDCWFCLASPSCEKHLITGVFDTCYITLPKGPIHPGHVLIVPVQHSSQGALKDPMVAQEMETIKAKLRQHASISYDSDLFVFERAIQTKGGYHTHVQCVPVPRALGLKLQSALLTQCRKFSIDIREINTDVGLHALFNENDDERQSDGGYFYAEIPMLGRQVKRFLYRAKARSPTASGRDRSGVSMQLGREIVALVLEDPKLAHWRSCLLEEEAETAMAASFRESFAKTNIAL